MNSGPLDGVRVLDAVSGLAGPYASMFLADQGADVVKVETGRGDPYRDEPGFFTVNRNKRSVWLDQLDFSHLGSQAAQLARAADIVFVSDPQQASEIKNLNPNTVTIAVTDWGSHPDIADGYTRVKAPSPSLVHAATGIAWNQQSYGAVPVDIVVPIVHYATGLLGAVAGVAGLIARDRRGVGHAPSYEVSLVAGAASIQLGENRLADSIEERPGDSTMGSKGRVACYRLVEARDRKWLFLACGTAKFYQRMLDVIGRPDLIDHPDLADPPWGLMFDPAIEHLTPILDAAFATKDRADWLEILAAADIPAQPVLTREEFLATSMVEANQMVVTVDDPQVGPVQMMGLPFTIEGAPGSIRCPGPPLGHHTDQVLSQWEALADETKPVTDDTGHQPAATSPWPLAPGDELPLSGVRVVDLSSFIAGPVAARHLAMLGADVIKVEPPGGDPFRAIGPMFLSWNQGKRSIQLDLAQQPDRAVLHRLVGASDITIENFRPGVAARLGVDNQTLRDINPNLVFLSSPGYGSDPSMADKPAFDPLIQALGGLMATQGGLDNDPEAEPVFLTVPVHDLFTPLVSTLGVLMALRRRMLTGQGQTVRTSLIQSTMVAQAGEFTRFAGRPPTRSGGFDYAGPDSTNTWHETNQGLVWNDGGSTVPVCTTGLTGHHLAELNHLTVQTDHVDHGALVTFGQLINGVGPPPCPAPVLDEHHHEILSELEES